LQILTSLMRPLNQKKVKERTVKNFVKRCLYTSGCLEGPADFYDLMFENSKGFDATDIKNLSKKLEQIQPKNIYEVGALAMMKYYLANYKGFHENVEGSIMSISAFKRLVEKGSGYKFTSTEYSLETMQEEGMGPIEVDEDFEENYGVKPEDCKFYELSRDTENRSELYYVAAIVTKKGAYMDWATDRVSASSEEFIPIKDISKYFENI